MRMRGGTAAVAVMMGVVASGCGHATEQASMETRSSSETTSSNSEVSSAQDEPAPPTASPAFGYIPVLEPVKGVEGTVTYDVDLPQLSGGQPAVRDRFNDTMRAALHDLINTLPGPEKMQKVSISDFGPGAEHNRVAMIGPHAVAGIQLYLWYAGGAHPNGSVTTIVINTDTAQPITYNDLFPQQYAALERLKQVLPELDSTGRVRGDGIYGPLEQWLPVPSGLRFYVPVAHAAGDYVPITLPWERIRDLVAPEIVPVLSQ